MQQLGPPVMPPLCNCLSRSIHVFCLGWVGTVHGTYELMGADDRQVNNLSILVPPWQLPNLCFDEEEFLAHHQTCLFHNNSLHSHGCCYDCLLCSCVLLVSALADCQVTVHRVLYSTAGQSCKHTYKCELLVPYQFDVTMHVFHNFILQVCKFDGAPSAMPLFCKGHVRHFVDACHLTQVLTKCAPWNCSHHQELLPTSGLHVEVVQRT